MRIGRCRWVWSMLLCLMTVSVYAQQNDSIATTVLVANYDYTCHSVDKNGEPKDVKYSLVLQVAKDLACSMGKNQHINKWDLAELMQYVPVTWQNYPKGVTTSLEVVPLNRYLTSENKVNIKWRILEEKDTILGYECRKAEGKYGGRNWIVRFSESLPTKFGPWRLQGLPGLILKAESDDGVHIFECTGVEPISEAVNYTVPKNAVKCSRSQFVKYRNRTFCNPLYLENPCHIINMKEVKTMGVAEGKFEIYNGIPISLTQPKYQPLDF